MQGYPIFSFWIPVVLTKIYVLPSFKPRKNITVFESITDWKTRVSRDAQNVCAITIVGTAYDMGGLTMGKPNNTCSSANFSFEEYILIQNVKSIYLVYERLNSSQTFDCVPHKN